MDVRVYQLHRLSFVFSYKVPIQGSLGSTPLAFRRNATVTQWLDLALCRLPFVSCPLLQSSYPRKPWLNATCFPTRGDSNAVARLGALSFAND
ncbi:MAG: hypothetical protein FWK04_04940 [Nostoc sp. GBBB01]|nr:hypothetical protein [Nostoc sp. GBBB01]